MRFLSRVLLSGKVLGAALLISGTSIGGGMLVLPVATAEIGFFPSISVFFLTWIFMTFTSFLMLESNLALEKGLNLISISRIVLGGPGKYIAWVTFLLLLYSLIAAYISGISSLVISSANLFGLYPSLHTIHLLVAGIILFLVLYGVRIIDNLNRGLIAIGLVCFAILLLTLSFSVHSENLLRIDLSKISGAFPIVVTAFGFHIVLPILVKYLDRDVRLLKSSLIIGSIIPLVTYIIWQYCVLGSIPFHGEGIDCLDKIFQSSNQLGSLNHAIHTYTGKAWMKSLTLIFSGFAILTSLIGVTLSLWDFLEDGVPGIYHRRVRQGVLVLLAFVPPLALVMYWPTVFSELLSFAGIFVALLLGLLPIWICWQGRKDPSWGMPYKTPVGKAGLSVAFLFFSFVIIIELKKIFLIPN